MKFSIYFQKVTLFALILFLFSLSLFAQRADLSAPREETLLNGLKILIWNQPNAEKATVRVRFHSGSAFDPKDKVGVMALLAEILFPNEQSKEFFAEDLGGNLEIISNYDYIEINASGKNEQVLLMLETIATAVTNPQIDKDTTARVKNARLAAIKEQQKNPAFIADQAAAAKLFGNYPYGRAQGGTEESLAKIDFADLILAKERFLAANNATIAVAGNFKTDLIYRAVRRYFGGWQKNDKRIPATFAVAEPPDENPLNLTFADAETSELRYAIRGIARSDKDFYASQIVSKIWQNRLQNQVKSEEGKNAFVRQEARLLPGVIIFGYATPAKPRNIAAKIMSETISEDEFNRAKSEFTNEFNLFDTPENRLNFETYKLTDFKNEPQKAKNVTIADVNRVAEQLRKQPLVTVFVTKSADAAEK